MNPTTSIPNRHSVAALTAMIMASGASSAQAAESDTGKDAPVLLPEVSVQAQQNRAVASPKFTAPLVDTPQTVAVIPQLVFSQQGAQNLSEVLRNTPGITFNAGENGFVAGASNFNIRGFESSHNTFIDGVRDHGNYNRDIFNVEQVEVAKGPAGDNGRGNAGGYVNLATKSPRAEKFGHTSLSHGFDGYASIDRTRVTADFNQPVNAGTAVRVNALWQEGGVAGRDFAEKNTWAIAPSLAFGLDKPTRLILSYQHLEQNDIPDYGVPGGVLPGTTPNANPRPAGAVDRSRFYGLASDYDDVSADSALARIEHDISPSVRLSNQTRYSTSERDALYTVPSALATDAVTVTPARQANHRKNETLANQTNLAASFVTGTLKHNLAAGLEFAREEADTGRNFLGLGTVAATNVFNPDPSRPVTGLLDMTPGYVDHVKVDTAAVYAYNTTQIDEQWQATGGLRLERYKSSVRTSFVGASNPAELVQNLPDYADSKDTNLSGKLGLVFKPARNGSLYVAWGLAVQPPGADYLSNPDGSRSGAASAFPSLAGQNNPNAKTQESINYELGTKWNFLQNRVATTLALFRSERSNVALASTGNVVTAYGEQTVRGIELGVSGQLTRAWTLFGGIAWMESEKTHINTLYDGDPLALTPKVSGNVWSTYRLPFGLTLGGGLQYMGESYVGRPTNIDTHVDAGASGVLPDYVVASAVLIYEVNKKLNLRLNVENLADKLYGTSLNFSARRASLGAPRSFLLSADYRF